MRSPNEIILITGSSGLIGSAVAKRFAEKYDVVGFDTQIPEEPTASHDTIEVDLSSDDSVTKAFRKLRKKHGTRLVSVIHLASYYDFSGEPSRKYEEITVKGTERLLHALQDFHVEQFVFSSTMLVHAPGEIGKPIDEDHPIDPKWDYPKSKVLTEDLIRRQHGKIPYVLLRIAGVYDEMGHSIPLAHQIQRIKERQITSAVYPGDTARGQAFLHLDDLVEAIWLLVERRAAVPEKLTLLLGEPTTLSYDTLQRMFGRQIHGEQWETRHIPKALAKTGAWIQDHLPFTDEPFIKPFMVDLADDHYEVNINRARTLLGWEPKRALAETLPKMVATLKADPVAFYKANKLTLPAELEEQAQLVGSAL